MGKISVNCVICRNLWFRLLLHQLMRGEIRTADLRGLGDFADE